MIITLCGSAKFEPDFKYFNELLTLSGHVVFSLAVYPSDKHGVKLWYSDEEKVALDAAHKGKIAASEAVVILNRSGYYGDSTRSELEFALAHSKQVFWLEPPEADALSVSLLLKDQYHAKERD